MAAKIESTNFLSKSVENCHRESEVTAPADIRSSSRNEPNLRSGNQPSPRRLRTNSDLTLPLPRRKMLMPFSPSDLTVPLKARGNASITILLRSLEHEIKRYISPVKLHTMSWVQSFDWVDLHSHPSSLQGRMYGCLHEGERWPGPTRDVRGWESTYLRAFILEPSEGLAILVVLGDLAKFFHRLRPQRLGINPRRTPVFRRYIDTVTRAASFELVRVYLLRWSRPLNSISICCVAAGVETIHA